MPIIIKNPYGILDIGDNPYENSYGKSIYANNPRYHISSPLKYPPKKRMGEAESPAMPKPHGAWSPEPTPHLEVQIAGKNGAFQLDFTMKHGSFSKDWT